jgi:adenylyltransferase/sulfurtransferase
MSERVSIRLPSLLRHFASGRGEVPIEAGTVEEALDQLVRLHPDLRERILASDGRVRSAVRVFLNARDVRDLDEPSRSLRSGDVLMIVPAISGG